MENNPTSRRKFIRQFTATGVSAAALIGFADVLGTGPANAAVKKNTTPNKKLVRATTPTPGQVHPDCSPVSGNRWELAVGQCGSACPSDYWCMYTFSATDCYNPYTYHCIYNPSGAESVYTGCTSVC